MLLMLQSGQKFANVTTKNLAALTCSSLWFQRLIKCIVRDGFIYVFYNGTQIAGVPIPLTIITCADAENIRGQREFVEASTTLQMRGNVPVMARDRTGLHMRMHYLSPFPNVRGQWEFFEIDTVVNEGKYSCFANEKQRYIFDWIKYNQRSDIDDNIFGFMEQWW